MRKKKNNGGKTLFKQKYHVNISNKLSLFNLINICYHTIYQEHRSLKLKDFFSIAMPFLLYKIFLHFEGFTATTENSNGISPFFPAILNFPLFSAAIFPNRLKGE